MKRLVFLLLALAACAKKIDQHAHTGPDGFSDGAEVIELTGGRGEAEGEVTYPGGDRVDWKVIQIPAGHFGQLVLDLEWRGPRDRMDLGMVVYEAGGKRLDETGEGRRHKRREGDKDLTIEHAQGTIYVLVYATARGDAGSYDLGVQFVDQTPPPPVTIDSLLATGKYQIPNPPNLASIPPACTDEYDPDNADCVKFPPPCDRDNPDKRNPSCKKLCNKDKPDPKNPDCKQFYPACDPDYKKYDKANPNCEGIEPVYPPPPPPLQAPVLEVAIQNAKTTLSISLEKDSPVKASWLGTLVDDKGNPVEKGDFTIVSVKGRTAKAYVTLSLDDANRYPNAIIYFPEGYEAP
jgi:hypothetical protein